MQRTRAVQPVSCDEAFLDVTGLGDPLAVAAELRRQIRRATRCSASCGVGPNMLLARLATKKAKPDGLYAISAAEVCPILGVVQKRCESALQAQLWSMMCWMHALAIVRPL